MTVFVLFINAPAISRVVTLILVPFNAWVEIKLMAGMSYMTMTMLILAVIIGELANSDSSNRLNYKLGKSYMHHLMYNWKDRLTIRKTGDKNVHNFSNLAGVYFPYFATFFDQWVCNFTHFKMIFQAVLFDSVNLV